MFVLIKELSHNVLMDIDKFEKREKINISDDRQRKRAARHLVLIYNILSTQFKFSAPSERFSSSGSLESPATFAPPPLFTTGQH